MTDLFTRPIEEIIPLEVLSPREQIVRDLDAIVREKGADYVYPHVNASCHYADLTEVGYAPSCIVGHVIYRQQGSEGLERIVDTSVNESSAAMLYETEYYEFCLTSDPILCAALERLQGEQDTGMAWGPAVERFKARLHAPDAVLI